MDKQPDNDKPEKISDELLDEYLDGGTPVSQAYQEMGQPEPSPAIDRAILEQAREAAKSRPQWFAGLDLGSAAFWSRWIKPMTTLVTMGICLAVVLEIMDYATLTPLDLQELELQEMKQQKTSAGPATQLMRDAAPPADMAAEPQARPGAPAPAMERGNLEEITVSSRSRTEQLQEVPLSVAAMPAEDFDLPEIDADVRESIIVTARRKSAKRSDTLATNALEAWENGARPAANVWRAGIAVLLDNQDPQAADRELQRMALIYPDAAAEFRTNRQAQLNAKSSATGYAILDEIAVMERKDEAADGAQNLADAWVWAQGIKWLRASGAAEEAAAEQEKFSQVYPDFSD